MNIEKRPPFWTQARRVLASIFAVVAVLATVGLAAGCTSKVNNRCDIASTFAAENKYLEPGLLRVQGIGRMSCKGEYGSTGIQVLLKKGRNCYQYLDKVVGYKWECREGDIVARSTIIMRGQGRVASGGDFGGVSLTVDAWGDNLLANYRCKNNRDGRAYQVVTEAVNINNYPVMKGDAKRPSADATATTGWNFAYCG